MTDGLSVEDNGIYLKGVRENGKLTGFEEITREEFCELTRPIQTSPQSGYNPNLPAWSDILPSVFWHIPDIVRNCTRSYLFQEAQNYQEAPSAHILL